MKTIRLTTLAAACGLLASICTAQAAGTVAVGPWRFTEGNETSRTMLISTVKRIMEHNGFTVLPQNRVQSTYDGLRPAMKHRRSGVNLPDLARYAHALQADRLVFGAASWHTRSIWVGTGPKTISTATIDLFIYNAKANKIAYQALGVEGRSDEKESVIKDIAAVVLTPLVTVVSGGPATPREQRAAQIALGRALRPWTAKHGNR